jgi:hypothetical protein
MGFYIQGPNKGKAQFIVSEYDGKYPSPSQILFNDKPDGTEWVCVVDNGPFEAAAWLFSEHEFQEFALPEVGDMRPRQFLLVPKKHIDEIFSHRNAAQKEKLVK